MFVDDVEYDEDIFLTKSNIVAILENLETFTIICALYKVLVIVKVWKKELTPDLHLERYGVSSDWRANIELVSRVSDLELLLGRLMSKISK